MLCNIAIRIANFCKFLQISANFCKFLLIIPTLSPALQVVMNSILMALIPLMNVAVLIAFFITFCAIMGMELFRGEFSYACADQHTGS